MTNFEKIKQMSIDEMARSCMSFFDCPYGTPYVGCPMEERFNGSCIDCTKHWLESDKNITVNYDNGEIETLNKGVVVSFDEIDNEEETIKVRYRMCDIKGKDLHLIVTAVVALAQELGMLDEEREVD